MKTSKNFKVVRLNGQEYDMGNIGILVHEFVIDSPTTRHQRDYIESRDGFIDFGTTYDGRTMKAKCTMIARDLLDYDLLRNEVFRIFDSREPFYIIRDNEPGKRWLVKYEGSYSMERLLSEWGQFEINFKSNLAYAESIGTTLDPKTFDTELWQTGQGLILEETEYTHATTTFSIYNAADGLAIDPRELPLVIKYTGASTDLKITNDTNGDSWQYTGSTISTDVLELNGIQSLKNGVSVFGNTNRKLIKLEPGWNDFTLSGTGGSFSISFDFRFYTL